MEENKKRINDILADAVRKYWEESECAEKVIVYCYYKYDDNWIARAEFVRPFSSDDFYNVIFDHDFCEGLGEVKHIEIVSAEDVFDYYRDTILGEEW